MNAEGAFGCVSFELGTTAWAPRSPIKILHIILESLGDLENVQSVEGRETWGCVNSLKFYWTEAFVLLVEYETSNFDTLPSRRIFWCLRILESSMRSTHSETLPSVRHSLPI